MAEIKKARLFLRRGSDTDRKTTTLCEGELGYSTDAFRVVIGDGSTAGGRPVGPMVHVSGGSLALDFQSKLTEASAFNGTGGYAVSGDIAILPAQSYTNAAGSSVTIGTGNVGAPIPATVMVLTGSNAAVNTSWVTVNSGIPWGNLTVQDDDISGDKIHGGNISGNVTFSGKVSATSTVSAASGAFGTLIGTGERQVFALADGTLSATDVTESGVVATGATGAVLAMATWGQTGSSGVITPLYKYGITSITEKLYSYANTNTVYAIGSYVANNGTVNTYTDPSIAVDAGTGVYEIVFSSAVDGHANRPVVIQAANWRGKDFEDRKIQDHTTTATIDYKWKSSTTLIVVFSSAFYSDSDRKSHGSLKTLYPNSGHTDSRTMFTVQVY